MYLGLSLILISTLSSLDFQSSWDDIVVYREKPTNTQIETQNTQIPKELQRVTLHKNELEIFPELLEDAKPENIPTTSLPTRTEEIDTDFLETINMELMKF